MNEKQQPRDIWWWYWTVTLGFIIAALAGWSPAYSIVVLISLFQLGHSVLRNGAISSFPAQVRLVYFGLTLLGLLEGVGFVVYLLLLVGTFMVVFMGRCGIALALKPMPWNREREIRMN